MTDIQKDYPEYANLKQPIGHHPGELKAARAWATRHEYRFTWQDDRTDALDCMCVMWDSDGRQVHEWIGGVAGCMSAEEKLEMESIMALEHMLEADVIPRSHE